jgi:hypothetical protein
MKVGYWLRLNGWSVKPNFLGFWWCRWRLRWWWVAKPIYTSRSPFGFRSPVFDCIVLPLYKIVKHKFWFFQKEPRKVEFPRLLDCVKFLVQQSSRAGAAVKNHGILKPRGF